MKQQRGEIYQSGNQIIERTVDSKMDKENHGFGIENVKNMVERNHGEITFKNLEERFKVTIIFAKCV